MNSLLQLAKGTTRVHSMVYLVVDCKTWAVFSLAHRAKQDRLCSEMTQEDAIYSLRAGKAGLALPS